MAEVIDFVPEKFDQNKLSELVTKSEEGGYIIHPELFIILFPVDKAIGEFTVEKQMLFETIVDNILSQETYGKFSITTVFTYQDTLDAKWKEYIKILCESINSALESNEKHKEVFNFVDYETDIADYDYYLAFLRNKEFQQGKYVTFRTMSPVSWYPRHLFLHYDKYQSKKLGYAWSTSKSVVCNRNEIGNIKKEIVNVRMKFPQNKDEIILDEMCFIFPYIVHQDFNKTIEVRDGAMIIHPYHLLADASKYNMNGFLPDEISMKIYIDYSSGKITVNKEKNSIKLD